MRRYGIAMTILASLLCLSTAQATPVILFNSYGPGDTYQSGGTTIGTTPSGNDQDVGDRFQFSGTESYQLAAIEIGATLYSGSNILDLWLMSDVAGQPGAIIEPFTFTGAMRPFGVTDRSVVATSVLQPVLMPDTPYWVVLSAPAGTTAVWNANLDPAFHVPQAHRTDEGPWSGGVTFSGTAHAFRVTGTPTTDLPVIPAPAGTLLATVGVGLVSWLRRRRTL